MAASRPGIKTGDSVKADYMVGSLAVPFGLRYEHLRVSLNMPTTDTDSNRKPLSTGYSKMWMAGGCYAPSWPRPREPPRPIGPRPLPVRGSANITGRITRSAGSTPKHSRATYSKAPRVGDHRQELSRDFGSVRIGGVD